MLETNIAPPPERVPVWSASKRALVITGAGVAVVGLLLVGVAMGSPGGMASSGAPQACITALDYADQGFGYAADSMGEVTITVEAILAGNYAGAEKSMDRMGDATEGINRIAGPYNAAKAECRN